MRLLIFISFMVVAAALMGIVSYLAGASAGIVGFRVVATLALLQIVYFLLLVLMSVLSPPKIKTAKDPTKAPAKPLANTQKQ